MPSLRSALIALGLVLSLGTAQALPPQAEADLLQSEIGAAMKAGQFDGLAEKFQRVASLKVALPESFEFHWGRTLYQTRDYAGALQHLERYISTQGRAGKFYDDALALYSSARDKAAEAARQQAERERQAAAAARQRDIGAGRERLVTAARMGDGVAFLRALDVLGRYGADGLDATFVARLPQLEFVLAAGDLQSLDAQTRRLLDEGLAVRRQAIARYANDWREYQKAQVHEAGVAHDFRIIEKQRLAVCHRCRDQCIESGKGLFGKSYAEVQSCVGSCYGCSPDYERDPPPSKLLRPSSKELDPLDQRAIEAGSLGVDDPVPR